MSEFGGNLVLRRFADETGGRAIFNTNDQASYLDDVIADASAYYLVGYAPERELADGKFHKIDVEVKRKGVHVVARRGYWAPKAEELNAPPVVPVAREVMTALTTLVERNSEIAAQRELLAGANRQLETQALELYEAAITDPLTGVYNRGHLLARLREDIVQAERERAPLSLLMTDFDHFKQINDRHGHLFGDRALQAAVERIRAALRTGELWRG